VKRAPEKDVLCNNYWYAAAAGFWYFHFLFNRPVFPKITWLGPWRNSGIAGAKFFTGQISVLSTLTVGLDFTSVYAERISFHCHGTINWVTGRVQGL